MTSTPAAAPAGPSASARGSARAQSLWISSARVLAGLLTIGIPLVLVRVLSQTNYGYYKQIFLVAVTAQSLLALGVPGSLYYFVPRERERPIRYQTQSLVLLVGLGLVAGGLILLGGQAIQRLFHAELDAYVPLLALFVALSIPGSLIPTAPMVDRRARLAAAMVVGLDLLRAGLIIGAAIVTRDLLWIVVMACAAAAVQLGVTGAYLVGRSRWSDWRVEPGRIREQLRYVLPFSGAAAIGFARNKLHAYYVAASFSAAEFAIYAAATLNIPLIGKLSQTIEEVVVLENAGHHARGSKDEMRRVWHRASHLLGLIMIPAWLITEAYAPELVRLLYGDAYSAAAPIFRVYLGILPLSVFLGSPMLRAAGDTRHMVVTDTVAMLAVVGTLVALTGPLGPLAAVMSLVIGKATYMLVAAGRTAFHLGLGVRALLPWGKLAGTVTVAAIAGFGSAELAHRLGLAGSVKLVAGVMAAGLFYAAGVWVVGLVPESEKTWIGGQIRRRLHVGREPVSDPHGSSS